MNKENMKKIIFVLSCMIITISIIGFNIGYFNNNHDNRIAKVAIDSGGIGGGGGKGTTASCSSSNCGLCGTSSSCANAGCKWNNNTCSSSGSSPTATPTPTPSPCPAGTYGTPGNCTKCAKGYFQDEAGQSSCKKCSGSTGYQDEEGKTDCKVCETGYMGTPGAVDDAHTDCSLAPIDYIKLVGGLSAKKYYVAKGETETFGVAAWSDRIGANVTVSWTLSSANFTQKTGLFGNAVDVTNLDNLAGGKSCVTYNTTLTASNSATSPAKTMGLSTCVYNCKWSVSTGHWRNTGKEKEKSTAFFKSGCEFYFGDGGDEYTEHYSRCCDSPPPNNYGYCYGDEPYIGIVKNEPKWYFYEKDVDKKKYPFKYPHSMVDNESECHKMVMRDPCTTPEKSIDHKDTETATCEVDVTSKQAKMELENSEIKCSAAGNFYTIKCEKAVNTGFDFGSDGILKTGNELFRGQGYKYKINVQTKTTCYSYFYPEVWKQAYQTVMDKMKKVWSISEGGKTAYEAYVEARTKNNSDIYESFKDHLLKVDKHTNSTGSYLMELYTRAKEIEEMVNVYNNYPVDDDYDETATLKMEYTANKKPVTLETTFIKDKETEGTPKTTKLSSPHNLGLSWLTNPVDYKWEKTREVELIPTNSYIEKSYGEVVETDKGTVVNGGNKVYIDYNADIGDIPIKIEVSGLGGKGSNSTVKNEKCSVIVKDTIIKYREVDVKNPFINSTWPKADNWLNTQYDFTKIIKENVWNKKAEKTIAICKEKVSTLQSSTASYIKDKSKPYLGICSTLKSSMQDPITKRLCSAISSDSNYENMCEGN